MNHIYKVIWNHTKHCYTVVSEIAKSHSDSTKRVRMGTTAALMAVAVLTGFAMPAQAAVSIGTDGTVKAETADDINALNNLLKYGVTTNKDGSVTVGGLTFKKNGEVCPDVVYGKKAQINWDSNNITGQISIGNNAMVVPGHGGQESSFACDGDVNHAAGAIAIGTNTYARTGSIMIGSHVYQGNMGDVTGIDTDSFNTGRDGAYGHTVNSTTIGTNSFTRGNLATTIGDYNIQSGKSIGYSSDTYFYGAQNFGATVIGALNSNESQSAPDPGWLPSTSGVANSIVGVANRVNSSNGTLVFGAGNEVTNSLSYISGVGDTTSLRDAKNAQDILKKAVNDYDAGGAVLAIGGANKADWARKSQLIGVGNTLTGTSRAASEYNMINGYRNEVTNATHTSIIGSDNKAKNIKSTIVMGDNNALEGLENVISLGNNNTVKANDAVAIGNGAKVEAEGGVAIGVGSLVNRVDGSPKGAFAPDTILDANKFIWTATAGAVSVGNANEKITRRITNVAAGIDATDAVNVAQLKKALESIDVDAGAGIKVDKITKDGKTTYKISTNIVGIETTTDKTTVTTNQTNTGSTGTSQGTTEDTRTGNTVTVSTDTKATHFGADGGQKADVKPGETLNINGDGKNISTSVNGNNSIKVKLNKDITVDSVTAGDTSIRTNGLTIQGGPSVTKDGINGGDKQVTNVAAGDLSEKSTDAVNGSQLFATNQQVVQNAQSISKLGNRINKVGAGAAALAALHPLDFDPDDKWDIAAGYGNYNGENAAAIGAYYRPNEDTMFSVGGSFGNGENMVNAGVSLKLGQGNHVSTSKVAMAKEIKDLRKELEGLKSALLDVNAGKKLDTSKLQLFPDVPKNHWAYEYVSTLKGNGVLTGYPDGEFKGDRPMTRYEFATMLYKAMLEGATLSDKILKEFAPELEHFTVDTVHQDKDGKPTVERVRTVKAAK